MMAQALAIEEEEVTAASANTAALVSSVRFVSSVVRNCERAIDWCLEGV
jgi:hypothetical protein